VAIRSLVRALTRQLVNWLTCQLKSCPVVHWLTEHLKILLGRLF